MNPFAVAACSCEGVAARDPETQPRMQIADLYSLSIVASKHAPLIERACPVVSADAPTRVCVLSMQVTYDRNPHSMKGAAFPRGRRYLCSESICAWLCLLQHLSSLHQGALQTRYHPCQQTLPENKATL